jgi:hypothetical protein
MMQRAVVSVTVSREISELHHDDPSGALEASIPIMFTASSLAKPHRRQPLARALKSQLSCSKAYGFPGPELLAAPLTAFSLPVIQNIKYGFPWNTSFLCIRRIVDVHNVPVI